MVLWFDFFIVYTDIFASKIISCILKINRIWKC